MMFNVHNAKQYAIANDESGTYSPEVFGAWKIFVTLHLDGVKVIYFIDIIDMFSVHASCRCCREKQTKNSDEFLLCAV